GVVASGSSSELWWLVSTLHLAWIIHEHVVRLAAFASKTELRKPEKRVSGLSSVERGAQPFRPARPVAGLRRIFRAITTACSDGFRRERAESLKRFVSNPGLRPASGRRQPFRAALHDLFTRLQGCRFALYTAGKFVG